MMLQTQLIAPPGQHLSKDAIINALTCALEKQFAKQRVLILIPDHTRSLPLPFLFRVMVDILGDTSRLDFMVALGTHPPLTDGSLNNLVGISAEERATCFSPIGLLNHTWNDPSSLVSIGTFEQDQIKSFAGDHWHPSLPGHVDICLNKTALEYDQILILGPTFPHEVVGFSGGAKYVFPGISGPDMINATHWLGALSGVVGTIGLKNTPVRAMIDAAAAKLTIPVTLIALVVEDHDLSGLFIGDKLSAWSAAVDLSAQRHIIWCEKPFKRVLSCAPAMYDELWTCAKAMYKLEPAAAMGGEVIIYAPHLDTISHVHGKYIQEIGYHILPYFLSDWERFKHIPLGVLAHSTHLRGSGTMENGIEKPNVQVTLASRIPAAECARLNLGYLDPAGIKLEDWQGREAEGILYVPKAGEILYRCI
jgi:nickel-dependent lactate racemase